MGILKEDDYDDSAVRGFVITAFRKTFNILLKSNEKKYKIDLLSKINPNFGVEVEGGKWTGDLWKCDYYSLKSNVGYPTVNIPYRKEHYWLDYNFTGRRKNLSAINNLFVRTNLNFTQFIIIRPETIRNKMYVMSCFMPENSKVYEQFMSFKREDVETYNLVNNEFILVK